MEKVTKTIYVLLFIALLLMPHFSGHIGAVSQPYVESLVMLFIFGLAYTAYRLNKYELRKRDERVQTLEEHLEISEKRMVESLQYIGSMNRKLPLLKNVSSDLLHNNKPTKKGRKSIFDTLLSTAVVSIAHARLGMFRFVEVATGRTRKEFMFAFENNTDRAAQITVGNRELLMYRAVSGTAQQVGDYYVIPASDKTAPVQSFLVLSKVETEAGIEYPILQAITDQAQLFYKYIFA